MVVRILGALAVVGYLRSISPHNKIYNKNTYKSDKRTKRRMFKHEVTMLFLTIIWENIDAPQIITMNVAE